MRNGAGVDPLSKERRPSNEFIIWQVVTCISLVLAGGIFNGVWHRTYAAGWNMVELNGYFLAPLLAWIMSSAPALILRRIGRIILIVWSVGLAYVILITADRLWFVNGSTYPRLLATEVTVSSDEARLLYGIGSLCGKDKGVGQISEKANGVFMRCGFEWQPGNTFLIRNYAEANRLWWEAHPELKEKEQSQ